MREPLILHLETATNICSVALSEGTRLLALRESDADKSHGSLLSVFMDETLKEAGLQPAGLDAISVSKGPGSYTGLRIGVSTAKGFAFAQNIPVIGVDTLMAVAMGASKESEVQTLLNEIPGIVLCSLLDAKRMEVYAGFYRQDFTILREISADIIDKESYKEILDLNPVVFFGNGTCKITETIVHTNAYFVRDVVPSAQHMIVPALNLFRQQRFEDTAYFEPYYLKDFIATIPKKKVL